MLLESVSIEWDVIGRQNETLVLGTGAPGWCPRVWRSGSLLQGSRVGSREGLSCPPPRYIILSPQFLRCGTTRLMLCVGVALFEVGSFLPKFAPPPKKRAPLERSSKAGGTRNTSMCLILHTAVGVFFQGKFCAIFARADGVRAGVCTNHCPSAFRGSPPPVDHPPP